MARSYASSAARRKVVSTSPSSIHSSLASLAAKSALRARPVGDPFVGAAEHQNLNQLLEDHPVRATSPVATEWMVGLVFGQEGTELLPDGLLFDVWLDGGHEAYSFGSGSVRNSPDDGASVPASHAEAPLLTEALRLSRPFI